MHSSRSSATYRVIVLSERWAAAPPSDMRSLVRDIVAQVIIGADRIEVHLSRAKIAAALQAGVQAEFNLDPVVLSIKAKLRRAGKGKHLVIANSASAEINQGLVELIKEAFAIRNQLLSGSDDSIETMSGRIGMNKFRLTSLVRLSYLAPSIIRALLAGQHPIALTPTRLLRLSKDLPHDWQKQRDFLGFAA
jgi:site-specific DNA recombinase